MTVLSCLDNNRADTLLDVFMAGTERFRTPLHVRTDLGMENVKIADFMIEKGASKNGITGKSTHNQRIDCDCDVYDGVLFHYYQLFSVMDDENVLHILNSLLCIMCIKITLTKIYGGRHGLPIS